MITLDLYRELQAATLDSFHYLPHDLFEANTFWELKMEAVTAVETGPDTWQVTLEVQARKTMYDSAGLRPKYRWMNW